MRQLWTNLHAATMRDGAPYGMIEHAAILIEDGRIAWIGPHAQAPEADATHDAAGAWATPGLIDCHTHLVFGGNRAREFELRLQGATYEELARAGGGILSTVRATRALDEAGLVAAALPRLDALLTEGVTTVEIKSGYGLETATELRMLRAARALAAERAVTVQTSFLGAHAVPPGTTADAYIDHVIADMLPQAAPLSDAVDGFCDTIGFTPAQTTRLFTAAQAHGLPVKLHAEQLSNQGGAALLAGFGGLSADHLEHLDQPGVDAMAAAGTVAVLLPGACYILRETRFPPITALRAAGVPMAVATDANPGSSPIYSPLLAMNLACTLFRLTPEEALAGFTRHAARALGLPDRGVLAAGMRADIALWRIGHPAELAYAVGLPRLQARLVAGVPRVTRLAFEGIRHAFRGPPGAVPVIDGVGFDVAAGQFVAVIGPSGCGKSTLLQMATRLLRPDKGAVHRDVQEVGLVPQGALLFPWKTLAQNVALKLDLQGVAAAERDRRVAQALHDVGLDGFGGHYPRQLSGGMQKRAAIARTLIYDPALILMDEPFGALDAQTRMVMQRDLQSLVARTGASVLLVTHDITEAVLLADEVVVLSRRPARLLARLPVPLPRPRDTFEPFRNPGFDDAYAAVWAAFRSEVEPQAA